MRKFCEHCYTEFTAQPQCPYCAARPGLQAHLAQGSEYLRQQKEKLESLRQEAAKGRSFGFLFWIIPAVLWMWLMSKAEFIADESVSQAQIELIKTLITYVVPGVLCGGLMLLGFFLSGLAVKRRKKKLAEFEPALVELFRVQESNYPAYQQYQQERYQKKLQAQQKAGFFVVEDVQKPEPSGEELWEISEEMLEERMEEIYPRDQVGVTGIFTRSKDRKEHEMDEKYKKRMEDLFIDGF